MNHNRKLFQVLTCVLSVCWGSHICAQQGAPAPAVEATAVQQESLAAKLASYIRRTREDWGVPGMAVAIVKDGKVVLCEGFGTCEAGGNVSVDQDTLFAIASNSKAFTAAALSILVQRGELSWDDHVTEYLPWLRLKDPMTRDLRIRDLLCHRSGLGTFSGDLLWWGTNYSTREVLERAKELEPASPFRSKYGYSNLMFLAAGLVIEEVSGQTWPEFVQENIFEKLDMQRTITSTDDLNALGNFATPHKTTMSESRPIAWMNWDNMAAAGGIISSADDMSRWLKTLLNEGSYATSHDDFIQVLAPASIDTMWQVQTPLSVSASYRQSIPSANYRGYGLGWSLSDYCGRKVVSHGGGYDGMYSQVLLVPQENLGVVVLTNSMTGISPAITYHVMDTYFGDPSRNWSTEKLAGFRSSRAAFRRRIHEATKQVATGTKPSRELAAYTGTFRCSLYGDARVELEENRLVLRLVPSHQLIADLTHLHYDTFLINWRNDLAWFDEGTAHFVSNAKGDLVMLELDVPNDDMWFYELNLVRSK